MNQPTARRQTRSAIESRVRPPPADLAELEALDALRRAWADLHDARAKLKIARSPVAGDKAREEIEEAKLRFAGAHRLLDAMFWEET